MELDFIDIIRRGADSEEDVNEVVRSIIVVILRDADIYLDSDGTEYVYNRGSDSYQA